MSDIIPSLDVFLQRNEGAVMRSTYSGTQKLGIISRCDNLSFSQRQRIYSYTNGITHSLSDYLGEPFDNLPLSEGRDQRHLALGNMRVKNTVFDFAYDEYGDIQVFSDDNGERPLSWLSFLSNSRLLV